MAYDHRDYGHRWLRVAVSVGVTVAVLALLFLRIGSAAFGRGIAALTVPLVLAGVALTALSTLCAAWRWQTIARSLDVPIPLGRAVAAYYRSQLLNSLLPGGVLGDAHRALVHGRDADDLGRAARATVWDRAAGQLVQAMITVAVLESIASPARRLVPVLVIVLAFVSALAWRLWRRRQVRRSWTARVSGAVRSDLRRILRPRVWPAVVLASSGVVVSHVALFVLVARAVAPATPVATLLPLVVIVQLAAGIPLSVAGWGLREGTAAWAFAAAGLGAAAGVASAAAYAVASLIALVPGAMVVVADVPLRGSRTRGADRPGPRVDWEVASHG